MIRCLTEFILENHNIFAAEAYNDIHLGARLLEGNCRWIGNGAADAAADHADLANALCLGRLSQRPDKVRKLIADLHASEQFGGKPDLLENDGDCPSLPVVSGNGQRDALSPGINAENDELSRLGFSGHKGRFNIHLNDRFVQLAFSNNSIHKDYLLIHVKEVCEYPLFFPLLPAPRKTVRQAAAAQWGQAFRAIRQQRPICR